MKTLLIDGDELAYKAAAAGQQKWYRVYDGIVFKFKSKRKDEAVRWIGNFDWDIKEEVEDLGFPLALERLKEWIDDVRSSIELHPSIGETKLRMFLTSASNFRYELATIQPYKGNRDPSKKPIYLDQIKEYIVANYPTEVVSHLEADDLLAIHHAEDTVIVTQDKDLNMVPGWRYSTNHNDLRYLTNPYCIRFFYIQMLTGDAVDNIPGLSYIGVKTANSLLKGYTKEIDLYNVVLHEYTNRMDNGVHYVAKGKNKGEVLWQTNKSPAETIWEIANLLYMRRSKDTEAYWYPPNEENSFQEKIVPKKTKETQVDSVESKQTA